MPDIFFNSRKSLSAFILTFSALLLSVLINSAVWASNCDVNMSVRNISSGSKIAAVLDWKVRASPHWIATNVRNKFAQIRIPQGETFHRVYGMKVYGCGTKRAMRVHLYCHTTGRNYTYNIEQGRYIRPRDVIISVDCDAAQMATVGLKEPKVSSNSSPNASNSQSGGTVPADPTIMCKGYRINGCYYTSHGKTRSTQWIRFENNKHAIVKSCNSKTGKCSITPSKLTCTALGLESGFNGNGYRQEFTFTGRKLQQRLAHQVVWDIKTSFTNGSKPPSYVQSIFNKTRDSACR